MGTPKMTEADGERIERKTKGLWVMKARELSRRQVSLVPSAVDRHYGGLHGDR